MAENIEKIVGYRDRFAQIYEKTRSNGSTITDTMQYLAEQIQLAYIAGANRAHIAEARPKEIISTGEILVDARNYSKDKGYTQ